MKPKAGLNTAKGKKRGWVKTALGQQNRIRHRLVLAAGAA